ncbi:hypothetical protein NUM_44270 [Actinocatenispora comari]|jgi:integrase|uniref:Tyr recombinase domain-containing protein n=1 Tax=Actinocatenispora comari TaxID=2807577 RepID=A0A8J4ADR4_9ACTN|nr:hypothetical protein NUM_44270 [Actinocatenispora comari]
MVSSVGLADRWPLAVLVGRFVESAGYRSPATLALTLTAARAVQDDALGAVLVGRLSAALLTTVSDRWRSGGVGAAEVRARLAVVRSALRWAVDRDLVAGTALHRVGTASGITPRVHLPVPVVRRLIAAAVEGVNAARKRYRRRPGPGTARAWFAAEQRRLLVYLVADTGLRRGELAGLRSDDLLGRQLWVERAAKAGPGGSVVVGPTKSHRHGRLTVTAATGGLWPAHLDVWYGPQTAIGVRPVWMFPSPRDPRLPVHPATLAARLAHVAEAADATGSALHAMRHTVATSLVALGYLTEAQGRLRHRRLDTTLRHYVDTSGVGDQDVADDLERHLLTA